LDYLVAWEVMEPGRDENFASKDEEGWDALPRRSDSLYQGSLLMIARLELLSFSRLL
jgi:hypothetical protein